MYTGFLFGLVPGFELDGRDNAIDLENLPTKLFHDVEALLPYQVLHLVQCLELALCVALFDILNLNFPLPYMLMRCAGPRMLLLLLLPLLLDSVLRYRDPEVLYPFLLLSLPRAVDLEVLVGFEEPTLLS